MTTPIEQTGRRNEDRRERQLDRLRLVLGAVAVILLGILTWSVFSSRDVAEEAVSQTQNLAQQVTAACRGGGAGARELEDIGACDSAKDAAEAVAEVAPSSESAPAVEVATDDQVRSAVSEYLRINPPAAGRAPSAAEVESAVTRVCQAIGCQGQPGTPGTDGADGQDASDAQVANKVAAWCAENNGCLPTAEEIQAAVTAYCSADPSPCVGPAGAQGPQGEQGQPGPVLPEYYETDGGLTRHCVIQPQEDAAAPPRYECTREIP